MNSNLIHNILNIAIAILSAVTAFLLATGCTQLPTGMIECSGSWINPTYTTIIVGILGVIKTAMNIIRDGFNGLTKAQPPVEK